MWVRGGLSGVRSPWSEVRGAVHDRFVKFVEFVELMEFAEAMNGGAFTASGKHARLAMPEWRKK